MSYNRLSIEENIARVTAIIEPGFVTTKQALKDANNYLSNAFDRIRNEVRNYDFPFNLHQYRTAKHEQFLNETQIAVVNQLVELRAQVKVTEVRKAETKEQREQRIAAASPIANIAAEFDVLKPGIKADYINVVRKRFDNVVSAFLGEWYDINKNMPAFVRAHAKKVNPNDYGRGAEYMIDEERLEKKAQEYADDQVAAFVRKLSLKLVDLENPELVNVKPHGFEFNIVGTLNGQTVSVVQNIKYTTSKLGTPFVQWPALIYVDGQRVSEKEFHDNYVTTEA